MDWSELSSFLQEIRVFLEKSKCGDKRDAIVDSLIEKCEFYISTSINLRFNDEVDKGVAGSGSCGTYLNMTTPPKKTIVVDHGDNYEQTEYIDMDDYESPPPSPTAVTTPTECPYMGLPYAHLKLNKNVSIIQENTKISGKKSTVTCALLTGSWLLYYSSAKPNALKPNKYFLVDQLDIPDHSLELTLYCSEAAPQTLHFETGVIREMWIKAIREELPTLEDGVYDDPNNLRMDDHLYKTLQFDYDIPKMPPKPVHQQEQQQQQKQDQDSQRVSSNRAEFQIKYQEIKEQLASQLKQQKNGQMGSAERAQRSNSIASPQKKFGRFMNMFRSATGSTSPPMQEAPVAVLPKKTTPEKTAKIMKYKRSTTIFSPDYEIVGS